MQANQWFGEGGEGRVAIHRTDYWVLDAADWIVEADGGTATLVAPDDTGDLQLVTCDFGGGLTHPQVLAWARQRAPAGTPIREVRCGQFAGVGYELVDAEGVFWREWLLTLAEVTLLVTYSCEQGDRDRHRIMVDRMLSSLADNRA